MGHSSVNSSPAQLVFVEESEPALVGCPVDRVSEEWHDDVDGGASETGYLAKGSR